MAEIRCTSCGIGLEPSSERLYCGHCGARVAVGVLDLEAYRTGPERFDRVLLEPGYAAAWRHEPVLSARGEVGGPVASLLGGLVVLFALLALLASEGDLQAVLLLFGVGLVWLVMALRAVAVGLRRIRARTERVVAIVVADQYVAQGRRRDPVGVCGHRVTLLARDGTRREVFAPGSLMGGTSVGDIGIAFLRADRLVDYRWFDVMAPPLQPGEPPRPPGCRGCGAPQRFGPVSERCAFCDEPLPRPDLGEFGARFRAAAASPAAAGAANRRVRGGVPSLLPPLAVLGAGLFFGTIAYQLRELLVAAIAWSPVFALLLVPPLAPLAIGGMWLWQASAPHRAGRRDELVLVVRTRREAVVRRGDRQVDRCFVTVAAPSGARRELQVLPARQAALRPGVIGVAHLRGDWLAGFTPLEPSP